MNQARGLKGRLALLLCLSALTVDPAWAQNAADGAQVPQGAAAMSPSGESASKPGWLLNRQNRVVNPFRATPAPGTSRAQNSLPEGSRPLPPGVELPGAGLAEQTVPPNATANALGEGWTCNSGYGRQGDKCVEIPVPENAMLDISGHAWTCKPGFMRQAATCVALTIPQNATLDASGRRWTCNYGFRRQGGACVAVAVPTNAALNKSGTGWVCDPGFLPSGQSCVDEATARLQQQAGKAPGVNPTAKATAPPSVTINSGENRQGRTSTAKVVIGRF